MKQVPNEEPHPNVRANIGIRSVLQVIDQIQQDERVPVLGSDLEDPLYQAVPATQHLPVGRIQSGLAGQEAVKHGVAVRQAMLKREPVNAIGRRCRRFVP
jgi:hypothetical protein